jgi:hypothetical protein
MPIKSRRNEDYLVFLSHSSLDRFIAHQCKKMMEELPGIRVFLYENDVEGGQSIPDAIRTNIRNCKELVVLLSPQSRNRQWVLFEVAAAWMVKKRIVAILDKVTAGDMPPIIRDRNAVDLNEFESKYLVELRQRAKRLK